MVKPPAAGLAVGAILEGGGGPPEGVKDDGNAAPEIAGGVGGVRPSFTGNIYGKMPEAAAVNTAADIKVSGRATVVSYRFLFIEF
jgi:hypothetical protein